MLDFFLLTDTRTGKYFGGGRADGLFCHWVTDAEQAKFHHEPESFIGTLRELYCRSAFNFLTNENLAIFEAVPPFNGDAYKILHFRDGELFDTFTIFNLLDRVAL